MAKMFRVMIALLVLVSGCMLSPLGVNFTADLNGKPFKAITGSWDETEMEGFTTGQIMAMDSKLNMFIIFIGGAFEEKEYSFESIGPDMFLTSASYMNMSEGTTYMSQSGTLTITSKTDRLVGEFEMTLAGLDEGRGESILEVTNGTFDLPSTPVPET